MNARLNQGTMCPRSKFRSVNAVIMFITENNSTTKIYNFVARIFKQSKKPRGHIAHVSNIGHNS